MEERGGTIQGTRHAPRGTRSFQQYSASRSGVQNLRSWMVHAKPWRYVGYRGFSTFVASDDDFFILRCFGTLHARVLLALQDRITVLESNPRAIDEDASKDEDDYNNGTFREDRFQDRVVIIDEIQKKLGQYCESQMLSYCASLSAPAASFPPTPSASMTTPSTLCRRKRELQG